MRLIMRLSSGFGLERLREYRRMFLRAKGLERESAD